MPKVQFTELYPYYVAITNGDCEPDDLAVFASDAQACNALSFFSMTSDDEAIHYPTGAYNLTDLTIIVSLYMGMMDGRSDAELAQIAKGQWPNLDADSIGDLITKAHLYDDFTRPFRGADDGTFDYCGTYMIEILSCLADWEGDNE